MISTQGNCIENTYSHDKMAINPSPLCDNNQHVLQKIYGLFDIKNFDFESEKNEETIKDTLNDLLKDIKFITYQISKNKAIICVEKKCAIIASAYTDCIQDILMKTNIPAVIDVDLNKDSDQINEEIDSLYHEFRIQINKNKLYQNTYRPVFAYIIRRYYYPSIFFKDPSFFTFEDAEKKEIQSDKNLAEIPKGNKNFKEYIASDFIKLRYIYIGQSVNISLQLHIDSLYLFVLKEMQNGNKTHINRVTNFFQQHSHRCLTKCYGYINNDPDFTFIYDFMSNESLYKYIEKHNDEINFFYSFMTLNRIFQSIFYLHSNSFMHRDITPSNILINHDHIPFLSDFETIRSNDETDPDMTVDFASPFFASPEQCNYDANDENKKISYPTDIFSFGSLAYYLFEKKTIKSNNNLQFTNTPIAIQNLIVKCVKYLPNDRPKIEDIRKIIIEEIQKHDYFEPDFIQQQIKNLKKDYLDLFLKENIILNSQQTGTNENLNNFFSLSIKEDSIPSFLHKLGDSYTEGQFGKAEYLKAKQIYEISVKLGNSSSCIGLGKLYLDGAGVIRNYSKAMKYFEKSIQMNNSFGYIMVGNMYINGQGVPQDYSKTKEYYEKSVELGNSEGLNGLAFLYLRGEAVKKDVNKALDYFNMSADKGNTNALVNLANIYLKGLLVEQNFEKAKEYYKRSAKLGYTEGYNGVGILYLRGFGREKNYKKALKYFEKSANQNNSNGYYRLGFMYIHGFGVNRDYKKALEYFDKTYQKGNLNGLIQIGNIYLNGLGVDKNYEKVKEYYEKAEQKNDTNAMIGLGFLYLLGKGVEKSYSKAKEYFEKASKKHNKSSYIYLGNLYKNGYGVEKNYSKTKEYYEKVANCNSATGKCFLAELYYYGVGVERDLNKAFNFFQEAAKTYHSKSLIWLGKCYLNGHGVEKNSQKAIECYEIAADKDDPNALNELGIIYLEGAEGIEKNYNNSMKYFLKSAESNNSDSFYYLGKMYYEGIGVEQDYKKALEFFEYSVYYCNMKALFYLGRIYENGYGINVDIQNAIKYYEECALNHDEIFIFYDENEWNEDNHINRYYYCSNNDLSLIYLTEKDFLDIAKAEKYLKIAANNEYPFGQNNLGLFYEFHSNEIQNAIYYYNRASKNHFALAEFNLGRVNEKTQNYVESFDHYELAIKYENEPLIFQFYKYFDERLEISKSFIICLTNLKLCLHNIKFNNIKLAINNFINAIFRPTFKFLFNKKCQSFLFNIKINQNQENAIKTNFKDFILNFPLFNNHIAIKQSNSFWKPFANSNDKKLKEIIIQFETPLFELNSNDIFNSIIHKNECNNNFDKVVIDLSKIIKIDKFVEKINNEDFAQTKPNNDKFNKENNTQFISYNNDNVYLNEFDEEIDKIFDFYNDKNMIKIIKENNDRNNNIKEFVFTNNDDKIERKLKCPYILYNFISKNIQNLSNEINEIIDEMQNILFTFPYDILFGRIKLDSSLTGSV